MDKMKMYRMLRILKIILIMMEMDLTLRRKISNNKIRMINMKIINILQIIKLIGLIIIIHGVIQWKQKIIN